MIAEEKECRSADEVFKGKVIGVDDCAQLCNGVATMFLHGPRREHYLENSRCDKNGGCDCLCEKGAKEDGACDTVKNSGYNLFKYGKC